jgi:hypothetical protein
MGLKGAEVFVPQSYSRGPFWTDALAWPRLTPVDMSDPVAYLNSLPDPR